MKYKNINSAIHNFGHSFVSLMNYVDNGYIVDELNIIHNNGYDIKLNWLTREFQPSEFLSDRLKKSIDYWGDNLEHTLLSQNVKLKRLSSLFFIWNAKDNKKYMQAVDDRKKEYIVYVNDTI
jgi:hypothetical protein